MREAEPAVFGRDFNAEPADVAQALDVFFFDVAGAIYFVGVIRFQKGAQLFHERTRAFDLDRIFEWMRMDEIGAESPEEEFADEAGMHPLRFASRFGDIARLRLGRTAGAYVL